MNASIKTATIDWLSWTEKAMKISGSFEGSGENWGNPVGNFDGAYLTCGLLGFTWKWNNQPPMILEFIKRHSEDELKHLMPKCGAEYIATAKASNDKFLATGSGDSSVVTKWSIGERVLEPYHAELNKFWSSPEMKQIQTEKALMMMGDFAKRKTLEGQQYYNLTQPAFSHFAYWFDQAVLNGTANTQAFETAENIAVKQVFDWMNGETGYTQKSFNRNRSHWSEIIDAAEAVQRKMWILAYLRSDLSREEFDTVTMCRRGSLALGSGWINDEFRKFDFSPTLTVAPGNIQINAAEFLKLAKTVGQEIPAQRLVDYKLKFRPNGDPRYWAIVDFNQNSAKKRFYLFDTRADTPAKKIVQYYVAHGKGSEGASDDGLADVFSNVPNSNCSSLGIYRCLDSYNGNHGNSLYLEGLEATNSKAFDRSIVLHGADYISDEFNKKYGRIGRSEGCFAVEMAVKDVLINELKNGSFIIAWKTKD